MPIEANSIGYDDFDERIEERTFGSDTVLLAGTEQMVVAREVRLRAFWDDRDEICGVELLVRCEESQLLILRQLKILPQALPVERGENLKLYFEMDSDRISDAVMNDIADSGDLRELFSAKDSFPPLLNLGHYILHKIEDEH